MAAASPLSKEANRASIVASTAFSSAPWARGGPAAGPVRTEADRKHGKRIEAASTRSIITRQSYTHSRRRRLISAASLSTPFCLKRDAGSVVRDANRALSNELGDSDSVFPGSRIPDRGSRMKQG